MGDSSSLQAGDWVVAVGCPVGLDFSVTLGVVSAPRRSAYEVGAYHLKGSYIQTDAALNSGNSGGPLVNEYGEVVGINTMVRTNTEAIGFAIPINRAKEIFNVLKHGKKPTHAYFGMEWSGITPDYAKINNEDPNASRLPEMHGMLVTRVLPGSPADKAGLRRNDVITEVNHEVITNIYDAERLFDMCKPGRTSIIKVYRGEQAIAHSLEAIPQDLYIMIEEKRKQQQSVYVIRPSK
jgi:S1-C subfamily serine protease